MEVVCHDLVPSTRLNLGRQTRNVVLFGECGVGKSSTINAILGQSLAKTSNDVEGCTYETTSYSVTLDTGAKINIWDTIGLDEGTAGRVPADLAKQRLKSFLQAQIMSSDGIDLLLFCVRGASGKKCLPVKRGHWDNYKFVFEEVCEKKVPLAMIVTHLESYDSGGDMDTWWKDNQQKISEFGFQICAHACVTILPPDSAAGIDSDPNRFDLSKRRLHDLLAQSFIAPRNVLLIGDLEDRNEFLATIVTPSKLSNIQNSDSKGASPSFICVPVAFDEHTHINFWNTSAFDNFDDDAFVTDKNLKHFVRGFRETSGIDLLFFCFRAGRPKIRHVRNYHLFHAAICRKKVPVSIVVLGSDEPEGADMWWQRNERDLIRRGFLFDRHLYIPSNPCQSPSGNLDEVSRRQLVDLVQEEPILKSWDICDDAFWVTVPNVRAVIGELSWPTTTVIVCDMTGQDAFSSIASGVQAHLRRVVNPQREYRFQQVRVDLRDHSSALANQSSGDVQPRRIAAQHSSKDVNLIMFFIRAGEQDDEMWKTLERFYLAYKGDITPAIVAVYQASEMRHAEEFWKAVPRYIRRRVRAHLTYLPGHNASTQAQAAAQEIMADMVQHRCLVDLGEKVGVLREILSVWKRYRSQRNAMPDRVAR